MEYFKHGDKVKVLFGQSHDRLQDEYEWNTEEYVETELRITKDFANPGQLVIGLEDFNINYPQDVRVDNDDCVIFQLFNYAFYILKEGKEFEIEKPDIPGLNLGNPLLGAKSDETGEEVAPLGPDTHIMDLINILKSLSVKTIIFEDGNEIQIK